MIFTVYNTLDTMRGGVPAGKVQRKDFDCDCEKKNKHLLLKIELRRWSDDRLTQGYYSISLNLKWATNNSNIYWKMARQAILFCIL